MVARNNMCRNVQRRLEKHEETAPGDADDVSGFSSTTAGRANKTKGKKIVVALELQCSGTQLCC